MTSTDLQPDQVRPDAVRPGPARPNQREHILDVALRLMSERGASATSMRQLARACDLQVAAIYHYFPSKDALLAAVVAERQYHTRLADALPIDPQAGPGERLTSVFVHVFAGAMEEQSIWRILIGEAMRGEQAVLPVGRDLISLLEPAAVEWVSEAVPEVTNPYDVAQLMVGQMLTGFIRTVFEPATDQRSIALECARPLAALVED